MMRQLYHGSTIRLLLTSLCVLGMLSASLVHPAYQVDATVEAPQARSNRAAQLATSAPGGVYVSTWNGFLSYPVPLLHLPASKLPLDLSLTYNSSWHDRQGRYGWGWQFSYNVSYARNERGDITVIWEDGRWDRFVKRGASFLSPVDTYDTLREYAPGKYALRQKEGIQYFFDSPIHKRLTRLQDTNGNELVLAYDSSLRLVGITDSVGRQVELNYVAGFLAEIVDPNSTPTRTLRLQYDALGHLAQITDLLGNVTRYEYDAQHLLTRINPPLGAPIEITYAVGKVTQVSDGLSTRRFTYDQTNLTTAVTDIATPSDRTARYLYDAQGRIQAIEDPLGNRTTLIWDERNNLTEVHDANGERVIYAYDDLGNLLSATDALGHITNYTYDLQFSLLTSVTDANGHATSYEYDLSGNLVRQENAVSGVVTYTYDADGLPVSRRDANGATTTYAYDVLDNVRQVVYPDGTVTLLQHNAIGQTTMISSTQISLAYSYDAAGHVIGATSTPGGSISYEYDAAGHRVSMTSPQGTTTYGYDPSHRLARLTSAGSETTSFTYDALGRLVRRGHPNGTHTIYEYDLADRLTALYTRNGQGDTLFGQRYEYDALGNRIKAIDAAGATTTYRYDALRQLIQVDYPDGRVVSYAYDALGNRVALTETVGVTLYAYDEANRLLSRDGTTYTWDSNGNLIGQTQGAEDTLYGYDTENRLTAITFPDGSKNEFTYYPDGRRLSRSDSAGATTFYYYDGLNILWEAAEDGTTLASYASAGLDGWISMSRGGSSHYFIQDGLGSIVGLSDAAGAMVESYSYDAFGAPGQESANGNPLRFTGREYDAEAEMYYLRARYYDPALGRFISADPLGTAAGPNLYTYVRNSPANWTDPLGLDTLHPPRYPYTPRDPFPGPPYNGFPPGRPPTGPFVPPPPAPQPPPPSPPPTGGGGGGSGIESMPLPNARPSFFRAMTIAGASDGSGWIPKLASTLSTMLRSLAKLAQQIRQALWPPRAAAPPPSSEPLVALADIFPDSGPAGTEARTFIPTAVFEVGSNAVDALAVEYVAAGTGENRASILATTTITRTYDHDYHLCGRFHGYTVESAAPVALPGILPSVPAAPWFWQLAMTKGTEVQETFLFVVMVNEQSRVFTVDSRWLTFQYPSAQTAGYDYAFNLQVWAYSAEEAYTLVERILSKLDGLAGGWTVSFANQEQPIDPTVLIHSAVLDGSKVWMTMSSWLTQTQDIWFTGSMRYPTDRQGNVPVAYAVAVQPGYNVIALPLGNILDAGLDIRVNGFADKVYVGSGAWFPWYDDSGQSEATMDSPNCAPNMHLTERDYVLPGCAELTGYVGVNGWAGIARTLNPNDLPVDVSAYRALTFRAKGDGKSYRVTLETASVRQAGSTDYHQFVFTTSTEWRQYVVPFTALAQRGWDPSKLLPFSGEDVISVAWGSVMSPLDTLYLAVDGLAFTNDVVVNATTALPDTTDAGPYTVTTSVSDGSAMLTTTLLYSLGEDLPFQRLPMSATVSGSQAAIPALHLGMGARYYIEARNADGKVTTDPVDAPINTYGFQVAEHPDLVVDTFRDTNPMNLLGNLSGTYGDDSGSQVLMFLEQGCLRLIYDVSAANSYAGYYSLLDGADLSRHTALSFLIKGSAGGEKVRVGLRDSEMEETKIVVSQYLPGGVTTHWQRVVIPLHAFARLSHWSTVDNVNLEVMHRLGSGQGTIYVDDIRFVYAPGVGVSVDNLDDMSGFNGVGEGLWATSAGQATISANYDPTNRFGSYGAGYRLDYRVTPDEWAVAHWELAGLDASAADELSLVIRGAQGSEQMHLYLGSRQAGVATRRYVDVADYSQLGPAWQMVHIPLQAWAEQGVDLRHLEYLEAVFEWKDMSGTVFLDSIRLGTARSLQFPMLIR